MTKCRKCGNPSHCGVSLNQIISQTVSGVGGTKIGLCKTCICDKCVPKADWDRDWETPQ